MAGIAFMLLIPLVVALFLHGSAWVSEKVLPVLTAIGAVSFLLLMLIGLPLSIFKKCRGWCSVCFLYWSMLCGLCLWMTSLLVTINLWGYFAAIIGLFFFGVGVFPIAVLACMFKGEWSLFFQLILQFVILFAARIFGFYLAGKAEEEILSANHGNVMPPPPAPPNPAEADILAHAATLAKPPAPPASQPDADGTVRYSNLSASSRR